MSLHALGATSSKAILIRVRNPEEVAAHLEGWKGTAGGLAATLVPTTTGDLVLSQIKQQLADKLKEANVDAEVAVVADEGETPLPASDLGEGVGIGVALSVVALGAWKWVVKPLFFGGR